MTTADDVLKLIKANDVKFADFRFTDPRGKWQHVTFDIGMIEEETFSEGMMFDGSSIAGWKTVHDSDVAAIGAPHGRERAARRHSTLGAQAAPLRYPRIGVSPGDVKAGKPIANGAALDARAQPFVRAPPAICVETTNSRHNWCVIPNLTSGVVLTGLDQLWAG